MKTKKEIIEQTKLAFDLLQKLYLETSYLVKEIEGILNEQIENFLIGRPSGYGIVTRSSTGLDANLVRLWLLRKFAVFFVEEDKTEILGGVTNTKLSSELKVLYLRIILDDPKMKEPTVYSGALYRIEKKPEMVKWRKFEHVMAHLEYNDDKVFIEPDKINYEDSRLKLRGKLITNSLYDINNSEDIKRLIIEPSLKIYNSV
jgi:hypothetical protein